MLSQKAMNIGIAGAGLLGRLMAWQLLRAGHQVTLFDRDSVAAEACAARVAAAMLAPYSEAVACEREVFDWGMQALTIWPEWLQQLKQDGGGDTYIQLRGSLVVAHGQDISNLNHFNQLLRSKLGSEGEAVSYLDQRGLQALEPCLAERFQQATFLSAEGCLDNWALLDNLALAIAALGGECYHQCHVETVAPAALTVNGKTHRFDWVIDTRGMGAKTDFADLRGVRGEVLWVKAPEVALSRPVRLMHPRYQLYIAPKPNDMFVIGATEIESESMAPITVRSSLELQSALYSVDTGFGEANIIRAYANCRPAFINNLPRVEIAEGLMRINGLYRHGYLLSPAVVSAALQALQGTLDCRLVTAL